uniref:Uncharacterized protein n=1 Tax=Melopsittacus undulatus TaxID=13146 RepID=A0A8V5GV03_MELUD
KVLQSLLEYWQDVLGRAVPEHQVPDVVLAAQGAEPQELGRMVLLVLACALCGQAHPEPRGAGAAPADAGDPGGGGGLGAMGGTGGPTPTPPCSDPPPLCCCSCWIRR